MDTVQHILRYIHKIVDYGLFYKVGNSYRVHGYTDADWASYPKMRRFTSGYLFTMADVAIT
jgi:hypothetical protein